MYQSPISIYETAMETIIEQRENAIVAKVQDAFDVQVDKDELIRALQYDRGQYDKGYNDAMASIVRCKDCVHMKNQFHARFCNVWCMYNGMGDDGFCNYGERKDNYAD